MDPIEKARVTLGHLSGDGRLTPEQCERFVAYATMPVPPTRPPWWKPWAFPRFLLRLAVFTKLNRAWEAKYQRENPLKNLEIVRFEFPVSIDTTRVITLVSQKRKDRRP